MGLFHFHNRSVSLPINGLAEIFQDRNLYTGKFAPYSDKTAAVARRDEIYSQSGTSVPPNCGIVTNGFIKALSRAAQVWIWPDTCGNGYGVNTTNPDAQVFVATYSVSSNFTLSTVSFGLKLSIIYDQKNNKFFLGDEMGKGYYLSDVQKQSKVYSEPFIFALWGFFMQDDEFRKTFIDFLTLYKKYLGNSAPTNAQDVYDIKCAVCKMADIAYYMTAYDTRPKSKLKGIKIPDTTNSSVMPMSAILVKNEASTPTEYIGNIEPFSDTRGQNMQQTIEKNEPQRTAADLQNAFPISKNRILTDKEKQMLIIPDSHIPGKEAYTLCKHIQMSGKSPRPIRNILLRGEAGSGKTETAKDIALGLGIPYVFVTCSSDTEIYDLLGQMMPDKPDEKPMSITEYQGTYGKLDLNKLPSATDISNDPEMAYSAITGKSKANATEADCIMAIIKIANASNDKKENANTGFHYVESPLVQAIRYGWVCEIQEPTVIAKPGVLVGLNGLLDSTKAVTLPTGEIIRRHPDAVIVATTNISYEGCRDMNQSVLSRFQLKMDVHAPDDDVMETRLRAMTGCKKNIKIKQMIKAYHAVQTVLKEAYLSDGSVDMRTMADWISSYMITGNYLESAEMTIIPSATADEDGVQKVREAIRKLF